MSLFEDGFKKLDVAFGILLSFGHDPNDFDFEKIGGVIYGRRRGT